MAERTIKMTAMALAGKFYEQKRSNRFRSKDSLTRAKRLLTGEDGVKREVTVVLPFFVAYPTADAFALGHWPLFYTAARQVLVGMLARSDVTEIRKQQIFAALKEDRDAQQLLGGSDLHQATMGDYVKENDQSVMTP